MKAYYGFSTDQEPILLLHQDLSSAKWEAREVGYNKMAFCSPDTIVGGEPNSEDVVWTENDYEGTICSRCLGILGEDVPWWQDDEDMCLDCYLSKIDIEIDMER